MSERFLWDHLEGTVKKEMLTSVLYRFFQRLVDVKTTTCVGIKRLEKRAPISLVSSISILCSSNENPKECAKSIKSIADQIILFKSE